MALTSADTVPGVDRATRRRATTMACSVCARSAPCNVSRVTGLPWCLACQQRWAPCSGCGRLGPILSGTLAQPLCPACTRPEESFWSDCPACGQTRQIRSASCERCNLHQRLVALLGGGTGTVRPDLQPLFDALAHHERPATLLRWLAKDQATAALADLGSGRRELTHAAFDALPAGKPVEHLRAMLVAVGCLPGRDEHLARLERWITATISDHPQSHVLHRYADWHVLRRLRARNRHRHITGAQSQVARRNVNAAITLLDWLAARDLTLAAAGQADLDTWLTGQASTRIAAGHFMRWAKQQKLTALDYPATGWHGPTRAIDTEARWDQARRLLHADTLHPEDRVAGLLVLLYAQQVSTLARLTLADVQPGENEVRLQLGSEPVVLPEPLAGLVLTLVGSRRGHAALGDQGTSPWLFPGGRPGHPISSSRLAERLRQIGMRAGRDRSTALFGLAAELPAALLARMLGIHINGAVKWQQAAAGDWTTYAADYARREPLGHPSADDYSDTSNT